MPNGKFALCGQSGSGKTTLLRLIAGLEKADRGKIEYDGKISMAFQEDRLFPWLNVEDNMKLTGAEKSDISEALEAVGLQHEINSMPDSLSGGMKRRIAVVRAVAAPSDILLLDEPFNALDEKNIEILSEYIKLKAAGKLVILVAHDQNVINKFTENKILLENKTLIKQF